MIRVKTGSQQVWGIVTMKNPVMSEQQRKILTRAVKYFLSFVGVQQIASEIRGIRTAQPSIWRWRERRLIVQDTAPNA